MAGAYNARESAAAADPGYPPGWPSYPWPFPGPYPPGYTPTLTLAMTATDSIAFDGAASVTGSARDQDTYATNEPSAITWSATVAGAPVGLRFSGDSSYSSSIESSVAFGTYWGATPSIEFDLIEDNDGDTVVLRGVYDLDDFWIENTESILIRAAVYSVTITSTMSAGYTRGYLGWVGVRSQIQYEDVSETSWGDVIYYDAEGTPDSEREYEGLDGVTITTFAAGEEVGGDYVIATTAELDANTLYDLNGYVQGYNCDVEGTVRIKVIETISGATVYDEIYTVTATNLSGNAVDAHWIEFDTTDGSYTVITT